MAGIEVVGEFDWIVNYDYLETFFQGPEMNIIDYHNRNILVIGCGTSPLSFQISTRLSPNLVVSLDNDVNCINYMKEKYKDYDDNMKWIVHDLVESQNIDIENMKTNSYDIIVDKGTFDAILVEGSIATMLCEIYRVLKNDGIYFLCSLHCSQLLEPLFTSLPLAMTVIFRGDCDAKDGMCRTIALCRKQNGGHHHHQIDLSEMIDTETSVMNTFYQEVHPLVTAIEKEMIYQLFNHDNSLSLEQIHHLVFESVTGPLHNTDYTFELFLEDLKEYPLTIGGQMTCSEFLEFLSTKQ